MIVHLKYRANVSNNFGWSIQHCWIPACWMRLPTMLDNVGRCWKRKKCWMKFLNWIKNIIQHSNVGILLDVCCIRLPTTSNIRTLESCWVFVVYVCPRHPTFERWNDVGCLLYTFAHDIQHFPSNIFYSNMNRTSLFQIRVSSVYLLQLLTTTRRIINSAIIMNILTLSRFP